MSKPRSRWYYWLDQLRAAGRAGVLAQDAVVRDPDRCNKVLQDMGYDISYRFRRGDTWYTLEAEPAPHEPMSTSTFPGDVPDVDDGQEKLFD
jgi:hypothetical protein